MPLPFITDPFVSIFMNCLGKQGKLICLSICKHLSRGWYPAPMEMYED